MDMVSRQLEAHGTTAYQSGHYVEAIRFFSDLVAYEPEDWRSRLFISLCLIRTKEYENARQELTFIAEKCPVWEYRDKALMQLKSVMYAEDKCVMNRST